ncbi:MAG: T9SS type A sorting domain-containing protein [Bacteriovoracaceae bacterium]
MRPFLSFLFFLFLTSITFSQNWIKIDSVFSPFGVTAQNFSAPEYCDLDGDGDLDLIVASLSADRIEYFVNKGTSSAPLFRKDTDMFSSIYANGTQYTNSDYASTLDIDHDGDFDLVIGGFNGLHLYWNGGDSLEAVWFRDTVFFSTINAVIGTDSRPAFADLDNDGDDDLVIGIGESLFEGPTPGVSLGFRNNGTPTVPSYIADNTLISGIPDIGLNAYPAFKDWDSDGDFDLVMGRDLLTMIYYKNTGTAAAPVWTNTGGIVSEVEATTYWKIPTLADLDGDGDFDLTYGTSDGTIYFYKNIGTKTAPQLQLFTGYFQIIRTDGNAATVSLGDVDKDGDLDFISGDWLGRIQYFRNDGDATHPNFKKTTATFTSLDAGSYSTPKLVDIDKDGDLDIVSGELFGTLLLWINNNGIFTQNATIFSGIDAGYRSAPAFVDIDNDGNLDMLLGAEESSTLTFYVNNGNNVFSVENGFIEGITSAYVSYPSFVDLDKDGDFDLVLGTGFGDLYYYENTGSKTSPSWKRNDTIFAKVDIRQAATPAFADFDGDGKADMIVGEYNGNFSFFKNLTATSVEKLPPTIPYGFSLEQNFPNPFNPSTTITFSIPSSPLPMREERTQLKIFDLLGREVTTVVKEHLDPGSYSVTWHAHNNPSGIYFYRLQSGDYTKTKRMLLLK